MSLHVTVKIHLHFPLIFDTSIVHTQFLLAVDYQIKNSVLLNPETMEIVSQS